MGILSGKDPKNISAAADSIRAGEVVAFPTETVYGLGADAFNQAALKKIFEIKGRPTSDPLILHIASAGQLREIAQEVPILAQTLIKKFWPGPLTLIFRKNPVVPHLATAGLETVAVRMPRNIMALALIKQSGCALAAPSANRFQSMSPTSAQAVEKELGDRVPMILDGGVCRVGVESTVLSLVGEPTILRFGGVTREALEETLGKQVQVRSGAVDIRLAPGLMEFHYAPRKPLRLFADSGLLDRVLESEEEKAKIKTVTLLCFSSGDEKKYAKLNFRDIIILSATEDIEEAARNFYSMLRQADEGPSSHIYALAVPEEGLGVAINDRLRRAQHG